MKNGNVKNKTIFTIEEEKNEYSGSSMKSKSKISKMNFNKKSSNG